MSVEANKELYQHVMGALNVHDIETAAGMITDDYVWHGPGGMDLHGREAWREMVTSYLAAFPDMQFTIGDVVAEGDLVAARWSATGTQQGELGGISATGKMINIMGNHMFRVEADRLAEEWETFDELAMLQQIGALPAGAS